MNAKKAKRIRKECRIFIEDFQSQALPVRMRIALQILKGKQKKGTN